MSQTTRATRATHARGAETRAAGDPQAGLELLDRAAASLLQACRADTTTDRYVHAHLGALRAAGALLATRPPLRGSGRARRGGGRLRGSDGRVVGVWESLGAAAPEFAEWADYLAYAGRRRVDLEGGGEPAGSREADDLLRDAERFLALVRAALGLPTDPLPEPLVVAARAAVRPGARPGLRPEIRTQSLAPGHAP